MGCVQQKQKLKERIDKKLKRANKSKDYIKKLLTDCKSWFGPCTSMDKLLHAMRTKSDRVEFIVKAEMTLCTNSHV